MWFSVYAVRYRMQAPELLPEAGAQPAGGAPGTPYGRTRRSPRRPGTRRPAPSSGPEADRAGHLVEDDRELGERRVRRARQDGAVVRGVERGSVARAQQDAVPCVPRHAAALMGTDGVEADVAAVREANDDARVPGRERGRGVGRDPDADGALAVDARDRGHGEPRRTERSGGGTGRSGRAPTRDGAGR